MPFGGTKRDEVQLLACQAPFVFLERLPHAFLERVGDTLSLFLGITSFSSKEKLKYLLVIERFLIFVETIEEGGENED